MSRSRNLLQIYLVGFLNLLVIIILGLMTSSCSSRVVILDGMTQDVANNVILVLGQENIIANKQIEKGNLYAVTVKKAEEVNALSILKANGLPNKIYASMGEIFKKDSFISSPMEEQGRFIYALQQQISQMLSQMHGVVNVQTQVSLPPPADDLWRSDTIKPAASVLIEYQRAYHLTLYANRIKELVANSVPGLTADRVEVVFMVDHANS
ncbi:MAG: type III secretion system inner membrane ring lipoprotein SctJ [Neisseriaceae bacterium]